MSGGFTVPIRRENLLPGAQRAAGMGIDNGDGAPATNDNPVVEFFGWGPGQAAAGKPGSRPSRYAETGLIDKGGRARRARESQTRIA